MHHSITTCLFIPNSEHRDCYSCKVNTSIKWDVDSRLLCHPVTATNTTLLSADRCSGQRSHHVAKQCHTHCQSILQAKTRHVWLMSKRCTLGKRCSWLQTRIEAYSISAEHSGQDAVPGEDSRAKRENLQGDLLLINIHLNWQCHV